MDEPDITPRQAAEYWVAMSQEFAELMRREGPEGMPLALALEHLQKVAELYLGPSERRHPPLENPAPDETA